MKTSIREFHNARDVRVGLRERADPRVIEAIANAFEMYGELARAIGELHEIAALLVHAGQSDLQVIEKLVRAVSKIENKVIGEGST